MPRILRHVISGRWSISHLWYPQDDLSHAFTLAIGEQKGHSIHERPNVMEQSGSDLPLVVYEHELLINMAITPHSLVPSQFVPRKVLRVLVNASVTLM